MKPSHFHCNDKLIPQIKSKRWPGLQAEINIRPKKKGPPTLKKMFKVKLEVLVTIYSFLICMYLQWRQIGYKIWSSLQKLPSIICHDNFLSQGNIWAHIQECIIQEGHTSLYSSFLGVYLGAHNAIYSYTQYRIWGFTITE